MESDNGMEETMDDKRVTYSAPVVGAGVITRRLRPVRPDVLLIYEEGNGAARCSGKTGGSVPLFESEISHGKKRPAIAGLNPWRRLRELGPQDFA